MNIFKSKLFNLISKHPLLLFSLYRMQNKYNHLVVTKKTNIVIEGFPRSGNTFAVVAFNYAQLGEQKIAHHLHAPAQIVKAAKYSIPSIVIIRHPVEAVTSLLVREPRLNAMTALHRYIGFYDSVLKYKNHFVFAQFEDVVDRYGVVIEKVNKTFKRDFNIFYHTKENLDNVFSIINDLDKNNNGIINEYTVARPSETRDLLKHKVRKNILNDSVKYLRIGCESLYNRIIEMI